MILDVQSIHALRHQQCVVCFVKSGRSLHNNFFWQCRADVLAQYRRQNLVPHDLNHRPS